MKRMLITAMLLLAILSLISAQAVNANPAPNKTVNAEQELKQLTREMFDAFMRGDKAFLDRLFADSFVNTSREGRTYTKAQILENVKGIPAGS